MLRKIKVENLDTYLTQISRTFPEFETEREISIGEISNYYRESFWGYAVFHSWSGAIHMALSRNGKFSKNDYFRQAEEIVEAIEERSASPKGKDHNAGLNTILELGCGRGFNVAFVARQLRRANVIGIDISERNLEKAREDFSEIENLRFLVADFHDLTKIDEPTSYVFAVESLCHAFDIEKVLAAIACKQAIGGRLIIFDGFRGEEPVKDPQMRRAMRYVERAMAVPRFLRKIEFISAAEKAGYKIISVADRSAEVMPNLVRLSDFAKGFFKIPPLAAVLRESLPDGLVRNAAAGLLMGVTVQTGHHKYFRIDLERV